MKVTIGGDRVGSGKKMQAELHNYYRSTHNLSEIFRSTMAPGLLYPVMVKPAMRGDTFDINIDADCRTIPTEAPLFGSYKLQVDIYQVAVRLYQGILHNNPLAIGLKMNQVLFPSMSINSKGTFMKEGKMCTSSLMKYLGLSGLGSKSGVYADPIIRTINAIPMLAYYDIYKTYYANKQEEKGYIITTTDDGTSATSVEKCIYNFNQYFWDDGASEIELDTELNNTYRDLEIYGSNLALDAIKITWRIYSQEFTDTLSELLKSGLISTPIIGPNKIVVRFTNEALLQNMYLNILTIASGAHRVYNNNFLKEFDLSLIDDMRYELLGHHTLGDSYSVNDFDDYPYLANLWDANQTPLNGLAVKTYQNDIFNNWLNSEWIEGDNGIKGLTDIDVSNGTLSMDALNLSEKLYAMLNRVALAGNTYEDWQDVVYEETKRRQIESPIFCGGMSKEVVFDEIVQSAPTEGNPLGTLGGRGRLANGQNGGHVTIKCDEACYIIAIASLTPRISYTQGNEFYLTELKSMDDLHKPALDGIGFQDLIGERLAWWDTQINAMGGVSHRSKIGKLPAWIEYMTSYDKTYGEFAELSEQGAMVLTRNYERGPLDEIIDATTYVEPQKFNYAFANADLTAQNFWMQIDFDIKARRLMSARMIPSV